MSQNLQFCVHLDNNHWTGKLDLDAPYVGSQSQLDVFSTQISTLLQRHREYPPFPLTPGQAGSVQCFLPDHWDNHHNFF